MAPILCEIPESWKTTGATQEPGVRCGVLGRSSQCKRSNLPQKPAVSSQAGLD